MLADRPPDRVLEAFGAGTPRPLPGGQGSCWIAGDVVLKPGGGPVYEWLAEQVPDVVSGGVRLATPVRAVDGAWVCQGWTATRRLEGEQPDLADVSAMIEIIEAGRAFHELVSHLPRPDCLDARTDPWARADRAVWREQPLRLRPEFEGTARRLDSAVGPLGRSQVVHADLTGNVLFAPGLAPAVIDISPYWRPPAYAEGVVVADALTWHGASPSLVEATGVPVAAVARALLFRMATATERVVSGATGVDVNDEARRYEYAATAIGA